jgi:anti-sigma factor RsiW
MFLGYERDAWRRMLLWGLATVASVAAIGFGLLTLQKTPEEESCEDALVNPMLVAHEVAEDLDIPGHSHDHVAWVVADQIGRACVGRSSSHHPVDDDLKGTVRQRLARHDARIRLRRDVQRR